MTYEEAIDHTGLRTYQDMLFAIDESNLGEDAIKLVSALYDFTPEQVADHLEEMRSMRF